MHSYNNRLTKIEQAILPPNLPCYEQGLMHYDDAGLPERLELRGRTFNTLPGEAEEAFLDRAKREVEVESLILVQFVKAGPNGGLAPGFERFAK